MIDTSLFEYHSPDDAQVEHIEALRSAFKAAYITMLMHAPDSRERSTAIQHLRTALMWANASVVLGQNGKDAVRGKA